MKTCLFLCFAAAFSLGVSGTATRAATVWTASGCGSEPSAPALDVSGVDKYNSSVDRAAAYEKAARAYNACVSKEANREETIASNEARDKISHIHEGSTAVQQRIAANFTKMTTTLKAAGNKFSK
ncbi:hypothetical protein [Acetobacter oeni]|uniref:Lipoprotein n=1 Tax=Acetobacter oeni TaxID=304077 RepID=A0A511XKB9_9PROT|nr:hypothetical protein [Acetobacter oeni]MBB3883851.1 membrane-bound lytic murein transglycosylase [Acetobacter oeni]NHO19778.1 hypothetical protein [Acetobacter oeni]GBR03577.1 hypothetical protein AA21952_1097 [Acetobacter oeni LMG 21952]GEN63395.1 hypothetical protein AOE01nite_16190 [Acetobacter oeni]